MNSSGSAIAENEKYMDSVAGKSEQLANAMQTMWNNTLNSDAIKFFLDLAKAVIKLTDKLGLLPTLLGVFTAYEVGMASIKSNLELTKKGYSASDIWKKEKESLFGLKDFTKQVSPEEAQDSAQVVAAKQVITADNEKVIAANNAAAADEAKVVAANNFINSMNADVDQAVDNSAEINATQSLIAAKEREVDAATRAAEADEAKVRAAQNAQQADTQEAVGSRQAQQADTQEAIASKTAQQADIQEAAASGAAGAADSAEVGSSVIGSSVSGAALGGLKGLVVGAIVGIISSLLSKMFKKIKDKFPSKEELTKAADEALNKYKESQKTLKDQKKTIDEISDSYAMLSEGVDTSTNKNIKLTTESYKQYLNVCNDIADMFPTLVNGYDEQGNAILSLKGNVDELTKAYQESAQASRQAVIASSSDVFDAYKKSTSNDSWLKTMFSDTGIMQKTEIAKEIQRIINENDAEEMHDLIYDLNTKKSVGYGVVSTEGTKIGDGTYTKTDFVNTLEDMGISYNDIVTWAGRNSSNYRGSLNELKKYSAKINSYVQASDSKIKAENQKITTLMDAYLGEDLNYASYSAETRAFIDDLVADLDASFIRSFDSADELYNWIKTNIVDVFESPEIEDAISEMSDVQLKFNTGDMTYSKYQKEIESFYDNINTLQNSGQISEEAAIKIKAQFDIGDYDTKIKAAKELLTEEDDGQVGTLTKSEIDAVDKYADEWKKLDSSKMTLEELKDKIKEVREAAGDFSLSGTIDDLNVVQSAFSKLGDAYEDFTDNGIITAEALKEIKESFGNVENFDDYIAVLGDSSSSMEDVKGALSGLATKYLEASGVLNDLTEENEKFIISQLKTFGVTNAEEYIENIRSVQEAMAENYGIDLSNYATVEQMKRAISAEIYQDILNIEDDQVASLAQKYGIDLSNYANMEQQKTAIAIAAAKARAAADKQTNLKEAWSSAIATRDATTVGNDEIEGMLGGDKLKGKTYAEVKAAYDAGMYSGKYWESQVKTWLFEVEKAAIDTFNNSRNAIDDAYDAQITEYNNIEKKLLALDYYVAQYNPQLSVDSSKLGGPDSSSSKSDSKNEFEETFDWVEVRLEEINEQLDLMNAKLENAADYASKNNIIDKIIGVNNTKMSNLLSGIKKYAEYAATALLDVPSQYRNAAKNGAIAITDFVGEANEKTVDAIKKYREWAQKVADLNQQLEETKTTIRELAIQKIDNAEHSGSVRADVEDSQTEKLQNAVDFDDERGLLTNPSYYAAMMENSKKTVEYLTNARNEMQKAFDEAVKSGNLIRGSDEWYENLDKLYQMDSEIAEARIELEKFQNAINDISTEAFDQLINRIEYLSDQAQGLIDIMSEKDLFTTPDNENGWNENDVEWTDEGLATLGLHAERMQWAEREARLYAKRIEQLNAEYEAGHYSEAEYHEELNKLTNAQYNAIKMAQDEKDAIVDLNKERIDAVKEGIEKQIDAYEELINKKKEELNVEKDMYDFQKSIQESSKNIADIQRKLAALANDNSMSAIAQRRKLEAELAEAQAEQEELYYERSLQNQQDALDKELEYFQDEKESEIEELEKYLEDIEQVMTDTVTLIQNNAYGIYDTLTQKAEEYGLTLDESITEPWQQGVLAIDDYTERFGDSSDYIVKAINPMIAAWNNVTKAIEKANAEADKYYNRNDAASSGPSVTDINVENAAYASAQPTGSSGSGNNNGGGGENNNNTQRPSLVIGSYIQVKDGVKWYSDSYGGGRSSNATAGKIKYINNSGTHPYNIDGKGWVRKKDIVGYYKGTTGVKNDQIAWIDELGEELVMHADGSGRLAFLSKGTSVIPHDITENLMELGQLDPSDIINRNRPSITPSVSVVNNNMEISVDASVDTLVRIEHLDGNNPDEITKIVNKVYDQKIKELNNSIRRFSR